MDKEKWKKAMKERTKLKFNQALSLLTTKDQPLWPGGGPLEEYGP
jgi:hypothetical protein